MSWSRGDFRRFSTTERRGASYCDPPIQDVCGLNRGFILGHSGRDDGQDLLEYALVLPLLLLLLLGIMEFGIVIFAYDSLANAAREGARYGIIHPGDSAGIEAAARASTAGLNPAALQFTITRSGPTIRVGVAYAHNLISAPIIEAVGGNPLVQLRTVATMRIE